jgi:hypothetical protein
MTIMGYLQIFIRFEITLFLFQFIKQLPMWYSATFIVKCTIGQNQTGDFLFDEQIKIINAANREEAYEKALKLGQEENHEYKNSDGELVKWTFEGCLT